MSNMEYIIIFILTCTILFLAKSNYYMTVELQLGDNETTQKLIKYADIKRKMERGEIVSSDDFANIIGELKSKHVKEVQLLEDRLADVIIKADEIAGERAQTYITKWRQEEERAIRADAIKRSQNVIKGKVLEHIVPHMPDFEYDPRDVRFIGTPLDYVVFEGLSAGNVEGVTFLEVKAGKHAKLSKRERQVRDAILEGKVTYKKLQLEA